MAEKPDYLTKTYPTAMSYEKDYIASSVANSNFKVIGLL